MARNDSIDDLLASIDSDDDQQKDHPAESPDVSDQPDAVQENSGESAALPSGRSADPMSDILSEAGLDNSDIISYDDNQTSPETEHDSAAGDRLDDVSDLQENAAHSAQVNESVFRPRGTKAWNTREPYLIKTDSLKMESDKLRVDNSFYFIDSEFSHENDLKSRVNREILKMKSGSRRSILTELSAFVYTALSAESESLKQNFNLTDESGRLFIYHIGPLTLYKIINADYKSKKIGYCYMMAETPGQVIRFYPEEFLKQIVMNWFEDNIHPIDLNFDSIQKFDLIRNNVAQHYSRAVQIFDKRFVEVNSKLTDGRSISKEELLKLKGEQWFGMANISVYKRFIPKTLF